MCDLVWQTGRPPKDGWYWVEFERSDYPGSRSIHTYRYIMSYSDETYEFYWGTIAWSYRRCEQWAGPIPEPKGGKDETQKENVDD